MEIDLLLRLHDAVHHISRAMQRQLSRDDLLRQVCEALVTRGGFPTAWIGWQDPGTGRLVPVSSAGASDADIERLARHADDGHEGSSPFHQALFENRPYVCNNTSNDSSTSPWRDRMQSEGVLAYAAFPIPVSGAPSGLLCVYSNHVGYFQAREVTLLAEACEDVGVALAHLTREAERQSAESKVETEQRFARGLIEAMPGIFYFYDATGRFLRWNRNFELLSGYSGDEILKMHPLDFYAESEKPLLQQRIGEVFENGEATVEASLLSKDGSLHPYFFTGKRIELDGEARLVGVGVDIAKRKSAEAAVRAGNERYRSTLDAMLEGCQFLDFDWRYLYLNPAAALQNRRPNADLLGLRMPDAWPGIDQTPLFALLRRCMEGRVYVHDEISFTFADGATGWFDVRAQPVTEGIFVLSVDITERKLAEIALRELNESLERKVAERTVDLEAAKERAESADRLKSAFLATMSHELRTPLNSILGFTGIVAGGMAGSLNTEQAKQLGMVQASARHLLALINDVLDISKIEAGQLEVRCAQFDLSASIHHVVASVLPLADKKGLALRVESDAAGQWMVSDQRRVEQILLNLLNNAIKFTDQGSISLSATALDHWTDPASGLSQPAVQIRVTDTGIGIKAEDLSILFQPFRQIDSSLQRQHEGTGLGLAICRRLTDLLGGTIRAESVWGQGSVMTATLPLNRTGTP